MLESKYEGTMVIKDKDIGVAILDNDKQVVNEVSIKNTRYNYTKILGTITKTISYKNKKAKSI